jgi:hypothetical protein
VFHYYWAKYQCIYSLVTQDLSDDTWLLAFDLGDSIARSVQISLHK